MDSIRILIKINPIYLLGWAGLIPFWGLTIVSHCNNDYANFATQLQVFYGAVILSFLEPMGQYNVKIGTNKLLCQFAISEIFLFK